MIIHVGKWASRAKRATIILIVSMFLFQLIRLGTGWVLHGDPYGVPKGPSVKVGTIHNISDEQPNIIDTLREDLRAFYLVGD